MSTESKHKTRLRDTETAARVQKTARITGLSERSVRRVIIGEQDNETALSVFMEIQEHEQYIESKLASAVRAVVPISTPQNRASI